MPLFCSKTCNKVPCTKVLVHPYFSQRSSFLGHPKWNTITWFTLKAHWNAHPTQPLLLSRRPGSETSILISSRLRSYRHSSLMVSVPHTLFHVSIPSAALFWESVQHKAQYCSSGEQQGGLSTFSLGKQPQILRKEKKTSQINHIL